VNITARRPKIAVSADGAGIVSHAGGVLLTGAVRATGLDAGLSAVLERWRPGRARHDPGKIIADLAVTLALGGDCLADITTLRAEPQLFGPVASVVSRLITPPGRGRAADPEGNPLRSGRCPRTGLGAGRAVCPGRGRRAGHGGH
jgi:hypothetical protein